MSFQKTKFRQSKAWKDFRKKMMHIQKGVCQLTNKKLIKGWNLHHLSMKEETYDDLNPNKFACLNRQAHETVHYLFRYYKTDRDIIKRLKNILDRMLEES